MSNEELLRRYEKIIRIVENLNFVTKERWWKISRVIYTKERKLCSKNNYLPYEECLRRHKKITRILENINKNTKEKWKVVKANIYTNERTLSSKSI